MLQPEQNVEQRRNRFWRWGLFVLGKFSLLYSSDCHTGSVEILDEVFAKPSIMRPRSFPTTKIPRPSPLFSGARDALVCPMLRIALCTFGKRERRIGRGKPTHQSERSLRPLSGIAKPPQCRLEGSISKVPFLINRIEIKI